ncbi:MAG: hypothetical protein ACTSXO_04575 [Candidatus Heimdallarchaeota archaeon]
MYTMFFDHLPALRKKGGTVYIESQATAAFEEFYLQLLEEPNKVAAVSESHAAALHEMLSRELDDRESFAFKGQLTGPISFGLQMKDEFDKPILYNEVLLDIVVKSLVEHIKWQEEQLSKFARETLLFIDEPYMALVGTPFATIEQETIQRVINELCAAAKGTIGLHCCANTDWALLLECNIDVISFDAYEYAANFLLYKEKVAEFLKRGGMIAWGLVPTARKQILENDVVSLYKKFMFLIERLAQSSAIPLEKILVASLLTPACGLGSRDIATAKRVFELTFQLSETIRKEYF